MKDFDIVHFYPSSETFDKAAKVFDEENETLQKLFPDADIQHVGSCSIPGAWGKFDIDIQIRVSAVDFENVIRYMNKNYSAKHPELWKDGFAIFIKPESDIDTDYLVTVIGSPYDEPYQIRDFLINHPHVLEQYNQLKMRFEGKPYHEYRIAKQQFMGPNGTTKLFMK